MGKRDSASENKNIDKLIAQYEQAKTENRQLYLDGDQLADMAERYISESLFDKAQEVISYGLYLHPGQTDLLIEQAYLYLYTFKTDRAHEIANSITDEYNTDVKMLKVEILLNEGEVDKANLLLNSIKEVDDLDTIVTITYLYMDLGYPEAAGEWLNKGKSRFGEEEEFLALTADYMATTSQVESAIFYYNRLIDIDPYNPSYWVGLGRCYFMEENSEKTIEACDFALAADDCYGEAYIYRAHSYFYLNNSDAAISDYKKAIKYKSTAPEMGYMFIGMAYANKEEWQEADDYFQKVIRIFEEKGESASPLLVDTYTNKAITAFQLGHREEAHLLCNTAKAISPEDCIIYLTEGKLYLKENLEKEASESFVEALNRDMGVETWYRIASAYADEDMLLQAKEAYEQVYAIDQHYPDVNEKLSILCLMLNEIDNFFKHNAESEYPVGEDTILDLLSKPEHSEEGKQMLEEVWKRMKKEKGKK